MDRLKWNIFQSFKIQLWELNTNSKSRYYNFDFPIVAIKFWSIYQTTVQAQIPIPNYWTNFDFDQLTFNAANYEKWIELQ